MTPTPTSGAADLPEALINIAREIEALKRDCGMDTESAIAVQNGRYMAISYKVRALAAGHATAAQPVAEPADTVVLNAAMRAIQQAIELIGAPTDERMRAVRRVLRGAVIVAEDDGKVAPLPGTAYAALPEYGINTASHAHFRVLGFTADQMRAFADATCALRASRGQAPADAKALAEADRRAGEAERLLATCKEDVMRFEQVRSRMKYQWGAEQRVSFDEVWDEALALKKAAQAAPQADSAQEDAARLDFLIEQRAYVVSDPDTCTGYWLHWARPNGDTWVQIDKYPTPRAAIDSARKQEEKQ